VLGFGGYREEALIRLRQAMRASPHDPLTWLWTIWIGAIQFDARDYAAALQTLMQLIRLRPSWGGPYHLVVASLAHLGRVEEARATLKRAKEEFGEDFRRYLQRPPWSRPEDYELRAEGLRLAGVSE
jgi:adenylate cyclase